MIKLVVSDIDGTLLPDGGHDMNPELYEVILKLRKAGMQFAAASGRQWASIEQVFDPIKEKIFYLSDNGAEHLKYRKLSKSERIKTIIDKKVGKITKKEIMELCPDISKVTVERTLTDLVKSGYIAKVGSGPATGYVRI